MDLNMVRVKYTRFTCILTRSDIYTFYEWIIYLFIPLRIFMYSDWLRMCPINSNRLHFLRFYKCAVCTTCSVWGDLVFVSMQWQWWCRLNKNGGIINDITIELDGVEWKSMISGALNRNHSLSLSIDGSHVPLLSQYISNVIWELFFPIPVL